MLDMYFIGLLKNIPMLNGVGVGNMLINLFGVQTFIGLNGAIETFVPQAVNKGKIDYDLVGALLNRGKVIIILSFLPMVVLFSFTEKILVFFNQDPLVSKYAQFYLFVSLPKLFLFGLFDCMRRWLNSLGYSKVPLIC